MWLAHYKLDLTCRFVHRDQILRRLKVWGPFCLSKHATPYISYSIKSHYSKLLAVFTPTFLTSNASALTWLSPHLCSSPSPHTPPLLLLFFSFFFYSQLTFLILQYLSLCCCFFHPLTAQMPLSFFFHLAHLSLHFLSFLSSVSLSLSLFLSSVSCKLQYHMSRMSSASNKADWLCLVLLTDRHTSPHKAPCGITLLVIGTLASL